MDWCVAPGKGGTPSLALLLPITILAKERADPQKQNVNNKEDVSFLSSQRR